jgi:DNA invertase Pin-like site-specific DNA recombinase
MPIFDPAANHAPFMLISVAEPDLCSDDPTRKLLRQIMGAIAEYDKSMVVLKLRGARQRKRAKDGRCEGAKPYGTLPGEAETLERIREMRAEGKAFQSIAEALNAAGVAPRRGSKWHPLLSLVFSSANRRHDRCCCMLWSNATLYPKRCRIS